MMIMMVSHQPIDGYIGEHPNSYTTQGSPGGESINPNSGGLTSKANDRQVNDAVIGGSLMWFN